MPLPTIFNCRYAGNLRRAAFALVLAASLLATPALAGNECTGTIFNPTTDMLWSGILPITLGGKSLLGARDGVPAYCGQTAGDAPSDMFCQCGTLGDAPWAGVEVSYWNPKYLVDVVKTPYCLPLLGKSLMDKSNGYGYGALDASVEHTGYFANHHVIRTYFFETIGLWTDSKCTEKGTMDLAYLSEPTAAALDANCELSLLRNPEALLYANPAGTLSCIPNDGINAQFCNTYDYDFWCAWGPVYPLCDVKNTPDPTIGSAALAARAMYSFARIGLLPDRISNSCQPTNKQMWTKSALKMAITRPVTGSKTFPIGRALGWTSGKNPPTGSKKGSVDQFMYTVFEKVNCCQQLHKTSSNSSTTKSGSSSFGGAGGSYTTGNPFGGGQYSSTPAN